MKSLLSIDTNAKTVKGQKKGYKTGILYLAPASVSGVVNVCIFASEACRIACLYSAGRGTFTSVQQARINKTKLFVSDKHAFVETLKINVSKLVSNCLKSKATPTIRLNGTSDINWERYSVIQSFPKVQFYDYTKNHFRMMLFLEGKLPSNYSLTFSRSETNETQCLEVLNRGGNVAVVFRSKTLPNTWNGFKVINGDENDLRFLDPKGVVIGLSAKGKAKSDTSGFVVD
jgi:archaellum component FlaF (FlaF/FlaG flagellin family)